MVVWEGHEDRCRHHDRRPYAPPHVVDGLPAAGDSGAPVIRDDGYLLGIVIATTRTQTSTRRSTVWRMSLICSRALTPGAANCDAAIQSRSRTLARSRPGPVRMGRPSGSVGRPYASAVRRPTRHDLELPRRTPWRESLVDPDVIPPDLKVNDVRVVVRAAHATPARSRETGRRRLHAGPRVAPRIRRDSRVGRPAAGARAAPGRGRGRSCEWQVPRARSRKQHPDGRETLTWHRSAC